MRGHSKVSAGFTFILRDKFLVSVPLGDQASDSGIAIASDNLGVSMGE